MVTYLPVPPLNEEAKERNKKLPGQGGVFVSIMRSVSSAEARRSGRISPST